MPDPSSIFSRDKFRSLLLKNSLWGFASHILQTVLVSLFFVFVARAYSVEVFGKYVIALTIYQLIASFSGLGLNQWFIREVYITQDKDTLVNRFFKMQLVLGAGFYIICIGLSLSLYEDPLIRSLSVIAGINIIFDNLINAIKSLNIADYEQKKTFKILTIDSVLRFLTGFLVLVFPFSILYLSVITLLIRGFTLNLFIRLGSSENISLHSLVRCRLSGSDLKKVILSNWPFIIISAASIINWRMSNIIISKVLGVEDVAHFEVSYKIFTIAQWIPIVLSSTVFPVFNALSSEGAFQKLTKYFHRARWGYLAFGLLTYTFVYAFADDLVPMIFGTDYTIAAIYTKEMFLTILVFPIVLLQANLLISLKKERFDMWLNVVALVANILFCFGGFYFIKSLSVVNYAIFFSFLSFLLMQDMYLLKKGMMDLKTIVLTYCILSGVVFAFTALTPFLPALGLFTSFWLVQLIILGFVFRKRISGNFLVPRTIRFKL